MKKNLKILLVTFLALVIGGSFSNIASAEATPSRVAIVNVQEVVNSSSKVQALKKAQEAKAKEFVSFIEKARKDVAAATDVNKKKSLEEKYTKELNTKKEANDKEYAKKLAEIDLAISNQIAKSKGYDVVISKGIVLYGGDDITEAVKSALAASEKTVQNAKKRR